VELHKTFCASTTGSVSVGARVDAVLVDAGPVDWTVIVDTAFRSVALCVRISSVALWAGTDRMVESGRAPGLWGTRVLHDAGIDASLIDAGLCHGALRVRGTLRARFNCIAVGEGISSEARWTVTADTVGPHRADSRRSARVCRNTRVDTGALATYLLIPTIKVGLTPWLLWGWEVTGYICISDISRNAHADHSSLG